MTTEGWIKAADYCLTKAAKKDKLKKPSNEDEAALAGYHVLDTMDSMGMDLRKDEIKETIDDLKKREKNHPFSIQTGLYGDTKNDWASAKELLARGNYLRGAIGAGIRTPIRAAIDTVKLPFSAMERDMNPDLNTKHMSSDQLEKFVNGLPDGALSRENKDTAMRALDELINNTYIDRTDPADIYANFSDKLLRQYALKNQEPNASVTSFLGDTATLPLTMAARLTGFNGKTRDEYEKKLKSEKK